MKIKLSLVLGGLLLFSSCIGGQESKVVTLKVKCEEAKSVGDIVSSSSYPGKVVAVADVNLSFRVAGVIDRVVVNEGQRVAKGQVVAYMDSRDYKLQLDATQAEYNSIKGEADRVISLYEDNSVSQNDYEKAVNGVRQITSKLAAHRNAYEDTNLRAPFDGYVQSINFDRGEAVNAGTPIMKFVSSSPPEVVVNIPVVEYLRRGELASATASVNSFASREFSLSRVGVSHKSNLNQLYETRFSIESEDGVYPSLGMSAMVTLNYASDGSSQVSIPFSAVVERDAKSYVWQVVDGRAELVEVKVDRINRDGSAVVGRGVSVGDLIITAGVNTLKEGVTVEPLPLPTKSNVGNIL